MRSFKSNPLALSVVLSLLGLILIVLVLPEVDLPDTAFQRNSSAQAIRSLSHLSSQVSANSGPFRISFLFETICTPSRYAQETRVHGLEDPSSQHKTLRC